MVDTPAEYPWSTYRVNSFAEMSEIITQHPDHGALGHDSTERTRAYRELFRQPLQIIQSGNNRSPIFVAEEDYGCFRHYLQESAIAAIFIHGFS